MLVQQYQLMGCLEQWVGEQVTFAKLSAQPSQHDLPDPAISLEVPGGVVRLGRVRQRKTIHLTKFRNVD